MEWGIYISDWVLILKEWVREIKILFLLLMNIIVENVVLFVDKLVL